MAKKSKMNDEIKSQIFMDYIGGVPHGEIAEKYGISKAYVNKLVTQNNWAERKTRMKELVFEHIQLVFVDAAEETVNRFVKNNLKAYIEIESLLYDDNALIGKDGKKSIYKIREIIESMHLVENQIKGYMNILSPSEAYKLQIQKDQLRIKELLAGVDNSDDVQSNFEDILAQSIARASELSQDVTE